MACSCTSICSAKLDRLRNWFSTSPFHFSRRATPGISFTSVFSHSTVLPVVHWLHDPQNTDRQVMTWSPGCT